MKAEVEQAVSTGDYTELEDKVDDIKSSHASGGVKAHASGGMISRTARRYAKQVLRHMKKIAKASHGRLGVYTLSELMNEGKAKTAFARAVIERAMINGITPAQAAKELLEQRGEARMMAGSRKWGRQPSNALYGMETDYSINADSFTSEAMNQQENLKNGIGYALYHGNYYLYDIDNDGMARPVMNMGESLDDVKQKIKRIQNGRRQVTGRVHNSNERNRNGHNRANDNLSDSSSEGKSHSESDKLARREQGDGLQHNSEESSGNNEGLDLSGVQLMEGSDGTVYGWCEIERDADGNVVARHIYLNDEVLNANTMVHELG